MADSCDGEDADGWLRLDEIDVKPFVAVAAARTRTEVIILGISLKVFVDDRGQTALN